LLLEVPTLFVKENVSLKAPRWKLYNVFQFKKCNLQIKTEIFISYIIHSFFQPCQKSFLLGAVTIGVMTFGVMTLGVMTLGVMTLGVMTFGITTLSINNPKIAMHYI
jgi:hypothetical protein